MNSISSTWLDWCKEYKKSSYTPMVASTHTLFIKHNSIEKVAKLRGVNIETIERQIIILIVKGIVSVDQVLEEKVKNEISEIIYKKNPLKLGDIKSSVSEKISWFQIKACIASLGIEA